MEAIFLVCGAGGPQLKRNPLGCNAPTHGSMKRSLLLASGLVLASSCRLTGQGRRSAEIPTTPDSDYYAWITQFSMGKVRWSQSRDTVSGRRYRAAVLTSEIFSTLVIESVSYGIEACCAQVRWSRRVNMEAFRRRFRLGAELAGLVVESWPSDSSFEFTIQRRRFLAKIGDGPKLTIEEL